MILESKEDIIKSRVKEPVLKTAPTIVQGQEKIDVNPKDKEVDVAFASVANNGYIKRFVPYYIYKPPFGFPRRDIDLLNCRRLAKTPFVFSVIKTLLDEISAAKWDIVANEGFKEEEVEAQVKKIKEFFYNPNGNNQSFRAILRGVCRDIFELDAGVIEKVYNRRGELTQLYTVDGSTILLNPDEHGYLGNRIDYVPVIDFNTLQHNQESIAHYYTNYLKEQAGYFQYNWTGGIWPVPFGKKELIYIMANDNTDSIYGTSPIQVLYNILLILLYGSQVNLDMYANNNIPTGLLVMLDANKDQIDATRQHFQTHTQQQDMYGNNVKKFFNVPISPKEISYVDFSFKAKDMQMLEQQKWYQQLVWSVFGVTPDEMGVTDSSNRSTANEQSRIFKRKALAPIFKLLEYHFNTQLVWELDPTKSVQFKFDDYDIESEFRKAELNEKLLNTTWTLNEIRKKDNMEKLEGDEYDKPKGLAPAGGFGSDMFSGMNSNDNQANKDDVKNEERSPEKEDKLFKRPDDIKILKHKYIKREGEPGNYTYYYDEPKEDVVAKEVDSEIKDKINSFFEDGDVKDFFTTSESPIISIKKLTEALGYDNSAIECRKKAILNLFEYKSSEISSVIKQMKTTYTLDTPYPERLESQRIASTLGQIGWYIAATKSSDDEKMIIIENLRQGLDNDIAEINKALKYMNFKERVKKEGLRGEAQRKSINEIRKELTTESIDGVEYKLSPNYIKNSSSFKTHEDLKKSFSNILNSFPDTAKEIIKQGKTSVHFITRPEAKQISGAMSSNKTLGYYLPATQQVFIFPDRGTSYWKSTLDKDEMKKAGYDDVLIDKLTLAKDSQNWEHTVTHELAHAVALNKKDNSMYKLQNDYSDLIGAKHKEAYEKGNYQGAKVAYYSVVSAYAKTNLREDFAETMAFYVRNKDTVDKAIEKDESWLPELLKIKINFLRDNLWK